MQTIQAAQVGQAKLYMSIFKFVNSYQKRGIGIAIHAHTEYVANVTLTIIGKKGTVQKDIVLVYDTIEKCWSAYTEGFQYKLTGLSELSNIIKSRLASLGTIVTKI